MAGRHYVIRHLGNRYQGSLIHIRFKEVDTGDGHQDLKKVAKAEVANVHLGLDQSLFHDPYEVCPATGTLVFEDPDTGEAAGVARILHPLRRAANIHWQDMDVHRQARSQIKGHRPCCIWFTGLSGAGKSTIANHLDQLLNQHGCHSCILDGDNVRHGLNKDLGFSETDRIENIRRISEVSRLMVDAGLITLVSFISPFRAERDMARERHHTGEFIEVFVDAPLSVTEARDPKGLYKKARAGEIPNFTGIGSPYEAPEQPEFHIRTDKVSPEVAALQILAYLENRGFIPKQRSGSKTAGYHYQKIQSMCHN
jgi:bifunctional enzyme CysN/CysC